MLEPLTGKLNKLSDTWRANQIIAILPGTGMTLKRLTYFFFFALLLRKPWHLDPETAGFDKFSISLGDYS